MPSQNLKTTLVRVLTTLLPFSIRKFILKLGIALAEEQFLLEAHRRANAPDQAQALSALAKLNFSPEFVVDVGAYEGDWARMIHGIWPSATVLMIEPNESKLPILEKVAKEINGDVACELLGAQSGEAVDFHVMETGSSVYAEQSAIDREIEHRTLQALDKLVGGRTVDILKIDVQGYELEVLKGAQDVLSSVNAVVLELSLIAVNKGAPIFHEMIEFMSERGFVLYDILEFHRRPLDGALWQIDCLFVPASSELRAHQQFG